MARILIAMRLRVLAHSLTGTRATNMITGGAAGLLLAVATVILAGADLVPPAIRGDLLAVVLAGWMFGWILGPVYTGGDDSLRPEHFALLPLRPLRLAFGLLIAGSVGIAPVVSLIAFTAIAVHAAGFGAAAVAVSLPAVVLQLVFVLALSRLVVGLLAVAVRSRLGAILAALVNAGMAVVLNQSWVVVWAAAESGLFTAGFPPGLTTVLRRLPSSWGIVAVEAAGRGDWLLVAAAFGGLTVLIAGALALWARLLVRRVTTRGSQWAPKGSGPSGTLLDRLAARGATGTVAAGGATGTVAAGGATGTVAAGGATGTVAARGAVGVVAAKELRTWSRDLMRTHLFFYALFFGTLYTLVPVIAGWWGMLP